MTAITRSRERTWQAARGDGTGHSPAELLVHREHVDLVHVEERLELVVADDLLFIARVLQVVEPDVVPQFLDRLRPRELLHLDDRHEGLAGLGA